ncbi:prephenate dehydratase [Opitutales bacterium ASA1]|jgi:chorismate mutase/prephenate dehydratase|uniref:prephenate dehydratase n=1 Tax=Congregicoccus parvus TaxID=3081749 RepID=UPI002B2A59C5|nr:prephenate dehydratase [Opitutales bacterium ASA1]
MNLSDLRTQIDSIDTELLRLLNERVRLAAQIGHVKRSEGAEIYVAKREEEVLQRLLTHNGGPLDERAIRSIYREIMSAAIALEKRVVVAYLGPEATFTHQAALKKFGAMLEYLPLATITDVFGAVEKGDADYGVIPIENSTEGAVFHSLDMLVESELKIVAQIFLEISHHLISHAPLAEITKVYSKDQAIGQCRRWLHRHLPHATCLDAESTARAVEIARDNVGTAAIASSLAAEMYGVPIAAPNIQDKADNTTRFLVVGKRSSGALGGGRDKSSYVFTINDRPGALLTALEPFGKRGLNLSKIESRPSKRKAWDYYFFVDVIGHHEDDAVRAAIKELETNCPFVKWLGSYPNL